MSFSNATTVDHGTTAETNSHIRVKPKTLKFKDVVEVEGHKVITTSMTRMSREQQKLVEQLQRGREGQSQLGPGMFAVHHRAGKGGLHSALVLPTPLDVVLET